MKSLLRLFRYGPGPSSSHTIAPSLAAKSFARLIKNKRGDLIKVTLHGSLALTGKGHGSENAIREELKGYNCTFIRDIHEDPSRPNAFEMALYQGEEMVMEKHYLSLGGGELKSEDDLSVNEKDIYPFHNLVEINEYMEKNNLLTYRDFCHVFEKKDIDDKLLDLLQKMFHCVETGLMAEGAIPANNNPRLQLKRTAKSIYTKALSISDPAEKREMLISAYAYAVSESNACGDKVVTAPTCGSAGVLPSLLYYEYHDLGVDILKIRDSLFTAGIYGNIVKQNASIAGAIGGCQAEIGTASSMGAAALCSINSLSLHQAEYAAECAMEHFLGLSCDPVDGYVIIPCIERNGMGALRSYDAYLYAKYIAPSRRNQVSFDNVVEAMKLTGDSLSLAYKETAEGGLAEILKNKDE
jgi:L-serine dehydratase